MSSRRYPCDTLGAVVNSGVVTLFPTSVHLTPNASICWTSSGASLN